jgi:hypothetical protein
MLRRFLIRFRLRAHASLPVALLLTLLQRVPELPGLTRTGSVFAQAPGMAVVLRSALMAAGSLGALHSVAGASVLVSSLPSPVQSTVGVPITPVGFTISNTGAVGSWKITGAFPPGLTLMDPETKTFITGPGVLDAATPITSVNGSSTPSSNLHPVLLGTPTREGSYVFQLQAWQFGQQQGMATEAFEYIVDVGPMLAPSFIRKPEGAVRPDGQSVTLAAIVPPGMTFQWQRNGIVVPEANAPEYSFQLSPRVTGLYTGMVSNPLGSVMSAPVIVGDTTSLKVVGDGAEIARDILHGRSGNTYDQILLSGAATLLTADARQVTRASYIDGNDDIVQIEFSGAGTVSVFLQGMSGPAAPAKYNQPGVVYVKGNVGIVIAGADETTNLSVFSVGRTNAVDASLFPEGMDYDGVADLAFIAIQSPTGRFGGLRAADASFSATDGHTGLFAPGVQFGGPVYLGDISAFERATPTIVVGAAAEILVTGGDLKQKNDRAIQVGGVTRLVMANGTTSHGKLLPAQQNLGRLEQDGLDVTARVVVNPAN